MPPTTEQTERRAMTSPQAQTLAQPPESLWTDRAFWGMTATQFLGAFNDNLFKQVVLLMCLDYSTRHALPYDLQPWAAGIFALPFVLFSGFAGFLADRNSKRHIVVLCKVAEILIVSLGIAAISHGLGHDSLWGVLSVLFLLGTHSAFFGPSKYGILPELVRERNLPLANGIFLMTTFVAIILGIGAAGVLKKEFLPQRLDVVGGTYLAVAIAGLATSLLVRRTPVALPGLAFDVETLAVSRETVGLYRRDRPLLAALIMYSVFWLVGGLVTPNVNAFGKTQLQLDDAQTSFILVFLTLGIAFGCVLAGWMSAGRAEFRLVVAGAWGMVVGLALMAVWGSLPGIGVDAKIWGARALLTVMGVAAGMFTVPLQVFLQSRPTADQKGRVIGSMNLINWIGILLSTPLYAAFEWGIRLLQLPIAGVFGATALVLLPVALFYRPRETPRPEA